MKSSADWESQIQQLRSLSFEMLELAESGEWETVTAQEEQRRALLDELFQSPPPTRWIPLLKDAVQTTLASNAQVQALARTEMDKISDDLRALRQGRRALSAYDDA
ncbi:MAG: flagellar protein FliT [Candidatus Competibacteraceae bacterium]|jgi:hypothetical protein